MTVVVVVVAVVVVIAAAVVVFGCRKATVQKNCRSVVDKATLRTTVIARQSHVCLSANDAKVQ